MDDEEEATRRSSRARARWGILRAALLGGQQENDGSESASKDEDGGGSSAAAMRAASIHRFPGFNMLHRRVLSVDDLRGGDGQEKCGPGNDRNNDELLLLRRCRGGSGDGPNAKYELAEYTIDLPESNSAVVGLDANTPPGAAPPMESGNDCHGGGRRLRVRTRERVRGAIGSNRVDLKALTSHRHHDGVDNTGNARVWDSESTLTHCLMGGGLSDRGSGSGMAAAAPAGGDGEPSLPLPLGVEGVLSLAQRSAPSSSLPSTAASASSDVNERTLRVVELGAGMAGLSGLALAALDMAGLSRGVRVRVTLTDGHPDAVDSNRVCSELTSALYRSDDSGSTSKKDESNIITCRRLLWNDGSDGSVDCSRLVTDDNGGNPFQLCLASDCVHFQEFHAALAATVGRLLAVGGIGILCQPHRGTSLKRFVALIDAMNSSAVDDDGDDHANDGHCKERATVGPLFRVDLHERYDDKVWELHNKFIEDDAAAKDGTACSSSGSGSGYDPSIHYPLVLVLEKLREYDEQSDTAAAVRHMAQRDG